MTKKTHLIIGTLVSVPLLASPLGLLGMIINILNKEIALVWFVSYTSHLILDSLTRSGIPLLMPIKNKKYGLRLFMTGGIFDKTIEIIGWILLVLSVANMIIDLLYSIF